MALLYLTVGLLAVVGNLFLEAGLIESRIRRLTIHLVTIGGMTQVLFGALPKFVSDATNGTLEPWSNSRWLR